MLDVIGHEMREVMRRGTAQALNAHPGGQNRPQGGREKGDGMPRTSPQEESDSAQKKKPGSRFGRTDAFVADYREQSENANDEACHQSHVRVEPGGSHAEWFQVDRIFAC